MADKSLTIKMRLKSLLQADLGKAMSGIKSFGMGVWEIGKKAAIGLLGIGTALAGVALKAVASFTESENAASALKAALRANGDEVELNTQKLRARADAIQDETGVSGEATVQSMARLRNMGVETAALEASAKAVIALTGAGMSQESAIKAVAQAHNGNFAALGKVIPALKTATSEAEKAALVNDFLAKGYAQSKEKLNTVSGAWGLLKERVGDVWEEIGAAIAQNEGLKKALQAASEKVKELGQRVADWAGSGGVTKLIAGALEFGENARHTWNEVGLAFDVLSSWIADAWGTTGNYISNLLKAIKNNWVVSFTYMKDMAVAVFDKIKHPFSEFKAPSTAPLIQAAKEYWSALKGDNTKVTSSMDATNKRIEDEALRHIGRLKEIEDGKNKALNTPPPEPPAAAAVPPLVVAQENAEKKRLEAEKIANEQRLAMIDAELAAREKLLEKQKALAAQTVAGFIQEARAKKNAQEAMEADEKRADKLRAKQAKFNAQAPGGRGKLSKADQEALDAANRIAAAKRLAPQNEAAMKALQAERDGLTKRIAVATEEIAKKINRTLEFDGGE
jgi:hypothetical protein